MSLFVVSARVHADNVDAVAAETDRILTAIAAAGQDVRFAVYRAPDGVTFITVMDARGPNDPLLTLPAYVEYQQAIRAWAADPPTSQRWELVGSHGWLSSPASSPAPVPVSSSKGTGNV